MAYPDPSREGCLAGGLPSDRKFANNVKGMLLSRLRVRDLCESLQVYRCNNQSVVRLNWKFKVPHILAPSFRALPTFAFEADCQVAL